MKTFLLTAAVRHIFPQWFGETDGYSYHSGYWHALQARQHDIRRRRRVSGRSRRYALRFSPFANTFNDMFPCMGRSCVLDGERWVCGMHGRYVHCLYCFHDCALRLLVSYTHVRFNSISGDGASSGGDWDRYVS